MDEELERIENSIRYGDKLDVYDINLLLKIIKAQQEEIAELQIESSKKMDKLMKIHQIINEPYCEVKE